MANDKRFVEIYDQGVTKTCSIYQDTETGVNYLFIKAGYGAGLTPLLDKDGKPVITPIVK